ncbi:hypothetical protein HDU87_005970 [Geranomyces variabilis]|uniref:Uncharacterized protein n=1 Tax=Geranomyces variabilis TaxID=109894 RepID=A0AAD5TSF2_9FUNG|nr:hypothetical protein HDU87_005970 [Geranomyces variabilis]
MSSVRPFCLVVLLALAASAVATATEPDLPSSHFGYADDENDEPPPLAEPMPDWTSAAAFVSAGDFASRNLYWIVPTFSVMLVIQILYFFWAAGRLMKETVVSVRAIRLRNMPVATAWMTLTDATAFPDWRAEVASVTTSDAADAENEHSESEDSKTALLAQSADLPAGWTETARNGTARRWTVLEHDPTELVHVRAAVPVLPFATLNPWLAKLHASRSPKWTIEVRAPAAAITAPPTAKDSTSATATARGKKSKKQESAATAATAEPATGCIIYLTEEMTVSSPFVRFALALWGYGGGPERCIRDAARLVGEERAKIHRPVKGKLTVEGA